ncbi:hypothetical protein L0156_06270 [bacterium]|nr:hypothetical protein [bacterium]
MLTELGFTPAESEVYLFLLGESPATGYRIAQAIGRPAAQTYRAIESLSNRGGILIDDGKIRMCRAVRPQEFLSQINRSFTEQVRKVQKSLRELPRAALDDRVYQIPSRDEVIERSLVLLKKCKNVALLDLFPGPLKMLTPDIKRAHKRGVKVAVKIYEDAEIDCSLKVVQLHGSGLIQSWPGEILNTVTDGKEFLSSLFSKESDKVRSAIWSRNSFLAAREHNGLSCEIGLTAIQALPPKARTKARIQELFEKMEPFFFRNTPGFRALPYADSISFED